jgi:hypothetical protein
MLSKLLGIGPRIDGALFFHMAGENACFVVESQTDSYVSVYVFTLVDCFVTVNAKNQSYVFGYLSVLPCKFLKNCLTGAAI